MKKIVKCDTADYNSLLKIWERSVLATHYFLTEDIIAEIKDALIPHYFPNVDLYAIDENGSLAGFVGLANDNIEMLFIDCNKQGRGLGSMLIEFAKAHGAKFVDVNEQNPTALEFYDAKGFCITGRDECDEAGRPFPILHLSLVK